MDFRKNFGKLKAKVRKSRATSPAPPDPNHQSSRDTQPTEDTEPTAHASEGLPRRLWNQAYDELKSSETSKSIVEAYEKILSSQLPTEILPPDNGTAVTNVIASDADVRWKQMERLVQFGLEKTANDADRKQKVNQWLEMIKPIRQAIDTGIKAAPEAAVPWAGICCALEILTSPLTEPKKNRDGMTYVLMRMEWYWALSNLLLDENRSGRSSQPLRAQLQTHVISLYGKLLLYEMKSVILYNRSKLGVFMRDLPKLDDWEAQIKEIKEAEVAIERDSSQYNTQAIISSLEGMSKSAQAFESDLHEMLLENKQHHARQLQDRLNDKDEECLKALHITNPKNDKANIVEAKGGLVTESYQWVIENESYQRWLKDNDDRLLWIKGDPGKGKTMLLCGIINELEHNAPNSIFYFFCQAAEPRLRTAAAVLRGLIWFLAKTQPHLISHVRNEYDAGGKDVFSDHNDFQALSNIIAAILQDETTQNYVFVIDALDECTENRSRLIALICRLSSSYKSKWIVSSRNWPEIEEEFNDVANNVRPHSLHLELNRDAIHVAVQSFIDRKVEDLAKRKGYTKSTRDQVLNHLRSNANDTFLWVSLVCEQLGKPKVRRPDHTLQVLKSFPEGLDELYKRMMTGVLESMDMDICKAILAIVTIAFEPLSLAELAVSDDRITKITRIPGQEPDLEALASIVNDCGSFLAIRNRTVFTVHQSASDFLQTQSDIFPSGIAEQHYLLFVSSMKVMEKLHRNLYHVHDDSIYVHEISKPPSGPMDSLRGNLFEDQVFVLVGSDELARPCFKSDQINSNSGVWLATKELHQLVEDALRFALTHRAILDHVPLQLYSSALVFSPERSQVRQNFKDEMSTDIEVLPSSFQTWDSCNFTVPGIETWSWYGPTLCFSPDGGRLAITQQGGSAILIVDSLTGEIVRRLGADADNMPTNMRPIAFSPEGHHLVMIYQPTYPDSLERRDSIMIWDSNTCDYIQSFQSNLHFVEFTALSQDGKLLALAKPGEMVHVWDPWVATCKYSLYPCQGEGELKWVDFGISTSGDVCLISIISVPEGESWVAVQSLETGDVISRASLGPNPGYRAASLHPDCKRLVVATYLNGVWIWDGQNPTEPACMIGEGVLSDINDVTWAPDGQSFAVATSEGITLWNPEKNEKILRIPSAPTTGVHYGSVTSLASLQSESVKMWRIDSDSNDPNSVKSKASNPIVRIFSGPSEEVVIQRSNEDIAVTSTATGITLCQFSVARYHSTVSTFPVVFGPDYKCAFVDKSGLINIWDTQAGECIHKLGSTMDDHNSSNIVLGFKPSGQLVSLYGTEGQIQIWDPTTGESLRLFENELWVNYPLISAFFNDRFALSFSGDLYQDGILSIWDSKRREKEKTFENNNSIGAEDLSWSSDGLLAVLSFFTFNESNLSILDVGQGVWVVKYVLPPTQYVKFDPRSNSRIDVGHGVIDLDLAKTKQMREELQQEKGTSEREGSPPIWNQEFLRIVYTDNEAWLMRGSTRVLWIPRSMANEYTFVVKPNFDTGTSVVAVANGPHAIMLRFGKVG
ncbi:WD domain protein [Fusarium subglutinans]|uniref:WD domain protein n=1 Tax=Gibberella subglutinans TaxID=42677 RepID=A0A8H5KV65_GIBSU|nr:WD domain protein [Fusarium subglutinans]KAF5579266.1 WD domain protein [Fusarium subglutinans]